MADDGKLKAFRRFAWFALGFNLLVILWGVFLRASKSGDGCGQHWLTCGGELIPSAPQLKTMIEFSHRISTAIDGIVMLILLVWGIVLWRRLRNAQGRQIMIAVVGSFIFVITEAAVGAGLVLTGNTAEAVTDARPFWAIGHLINTFILLAFLTMTVWFAEGQRRLKAFADKKAAAFAIVGLLAILFVGMSGALAALSNMLFPSASVAEGIAKDLSPASNIILRLRISHPILSVLTGVFIIFLAGWLKRRFENADVTKWSNIVSIFVLVQLAFGAATLLMLGPIVMQLGHLLLADLIWISFVLLCANSFAANGQKEGLP